MYDREALKRGIYEKYLNVNENDDFFSMKIGFENDKDKYSRKLGNIAAIVILGILAGSVRICCI